MTTPNFLAKTIPVLLLSGLGVAVSAGWSPSPQVKKKPAAKKAPSPAVAAPKAPAKAASLAAAVRDWRSAPSPAKKSAIEAWIAAHPADAPAGSLALGIGDYEQRDFPSAIASLKKVRGKLPAIADYTGFYLAAARVEAKDFTGIAADLEPDHAAPRSPFAARAWILQARALEDFVPLQAVAILQDHYAELPQPEGDINLADAFLAAGDDQRAAEAYQRVFYNYISGDASVRAAAGIANLKQSMGDAYPAPSTVLRLHRADRMLDARNYNDARNEYRSLSTELSGLERDQARVRVGAAGYLKGETSIAYPYLRSLELPDSDAGAERLYYLVECARRLTDDDEMRTGLDTLLSHYPRSPWRLKALIAAANRFLLANQPDQFVPLYQAVYQDFPAAAEAGLAHWRVAFQAFLHDRPDAANLLREHLRNYPGHTTAGAAVYFLGRRLQLDGDLAGARSCYAFLVRVHENHYYAWLARRRLDEPAIGAAGNSADLAGFLAGVNLPAARPYPRDPAPATLTRIDRSRILRTAGLDDLADSELRFGARTEGQSALLGMEMAAAAGAPHQAMHLMKSMAPDYLNLALTDAPRGFWEALFPLPYRTDLEKFARERGLDPFLVAGLIRQESEFDPFALSPAKAYGLTQVLPVTGREFARKLGILKFTNRMLFQPATNLQLGTAIFSSMVSHTNGHVEEALAAYNAGPTRWANWITWNPYREPAEFVESIPFTETRDYVQAVLRNADIYRRLYR
jgi:soluble lytic murein transglycosylase